MAAPEHMTRQELLEARDKVRRELEAITNPVRGQDIFGADPIIEQLRAVLSDIETELAEPESKRV